MTLPEELVPVLPELIVAAGAVLLLAICRVRVLAQRSGDLALLVVALAAVASVASLDQAQGWMLHGWTVADPFAAFFRFLLATVAMATAWLSTRAREAAGAGDAVGWSLLLVSLLGTFTMASASHAVAAWCGWTLAGVAAAAWAARRAVTDSTDRAPLPATGTTATGGAAISLLILSIAASAAMLFGFAMLHALSGTLAYGAMPAAISAALSSPGGEAAAFAAFALVAAAVAFPIGCAPWSAARAELASRSSLAVTLWVTVGGGLAGLALLVRFVRSALVSTETLSTSGSWHAVPAGPWPELLSIAAMVTMLEGNARALVERDLRRLVVWLAVAQAGALLAGLVALGHSSLSALLFHAVAFAMAVAGLVAALAPVVDAAGSAGVESLRGLARRGRSGRAAAGAVSVFVFSLTALPPFAGYVGRTLIFASVVDAGRPVLAAAAAIASALGVLVGIRLLATMLERPAEPSPQVEPDFESALLAGLLLAGTVLVGVLPSGLQSLAERAVVFFAG